MSTWPKPLTFIPSPHETVLDPPTCARCHTGHLILRSGPWGSFYGCSTYPVCKATFSHYDANMMYDCQDPWDTFGEQPF